MLAYQVSEKKMAKEIIKIEKEIEPIQKCRVTRTSLEIPPNTTFEEWTKIGTVLKTFYRSNKWWIGDWITFGEKKYGEMYAQAMEETDYEYNTLANYKWVASRVESSRRRELLSFTHHYEVAKFEPKEQEKWLVRAEKEGWNRAEMRMQIKEREREIIPLPEGKYEIIYSDPAWEYPSEQHAKAGEPTTGGSETHYKQVMSDEKLCQLRIQDIAADNCLLFMWTTGPKMESAIGVGKAWGFEYSTVGFVWYKELPNPGTYTMSECEYCLIFRKGNIPQPRGDRNVRQFLSEKRTEHSKKPTEIRRRIESMFPKQKKIELFARGKAPKGWEFWGDEANGN